MRASLQQVRTLVGAWPGVLAWRRRRYARLFASATDANLFQGVYASFAEAAAAAPSTKPVGYDNPGPAQMYRDVLERINARDYPLLYWLDRLLATGARHVLDFGGHVGTKFYPFQRYLEPPADWRWTVCDVPAVAQAGEHLRATRADGARLRFVTRVEDAASVDVFMAMGSPQYVETALADLLGRLPSLPTHLLLNGLPLYDGPDLVTLQSIGSAFCPYRFFNRAGFIAALEGLGYELRDAWSNPEKSARVPFEAGCVVEAYSGLYLHRAGGTV